MHSNLRRTQGDNLEFRNTSAYCYAPHMQSLKEDEHTNMGKIERRSIVDNSLAFFGANAQTMEDPFDAVKSRSDKRGFPHHTGGPPRSQKLVRGRWDATANHEKKHTGSNFLEEVKAHRRPSLIKEEHAT